MFGLVTNHVGHRHPDDHDDDVDHDGDPDDHDDPDDHHYHHDDHDDDDVDFAGRPLLVAESLP